MRAKSKCQFASEIKKVNLGILIKRAPKHGELCYLKLLVAFVHLTWIHQLVTYSDLKSKVRMLTDTAKNC